MHNSPSILVSSTLQHEEPTKNKLKATHKNNTMLSLARMAFTKASKLNVCVYAFMKWSCKREDEREKKKTNINRYQFIHIHRVCTYSSNHT